MGLIGCELPCAAEAPAPAGPWAATGATPAVKEIQIPSSRIAPAKTVCLIPAPLVRTPDKSDVPNGASHPVGHSAGAVKHNEARCTTTIDHAGHSNRCVSLRAAPLPVN